MTKHKSCTLIDDETYIKHDSNSFPVESFTSRLHVGLWWEESWSCLATSSWRSFGKRFVIVACKRNHSLHPRRRHSKFTSKTGWIFRIARNFDQSNNTEQFPSSYYDQAAGQSWFSSKFWQNGRNYLISEEGSSHEWNFKLIESWITGLFVRTNLLLANLPKHCTFLRALRHILERDVVYLTGSPSFKSRLKLRK